MLEPKIELSINIPEMDNLKELLKKHQQLVWDLGKSLAEIEKAQLHAQLKLNSRTE